MYSEPNQFCTAKPNHTQWRYRYDPYAPSAVVYVNHSDSESSDEAEKSRNVTATSTPTPQWLPLEAYEAEEDTTTCFVGEVDEHCSSAPGLQLSEESLQKIAQGTLHTALWGLVSFIPYPEEEFRFPIDTIHPLRGDELVRCFIGQLPYYITDMQLSWLCYTFGGRNSVVFTERIMKKNSNTTSGNGGERMPTGCVHAYTTAEALETMEALMHKRLLIDDTGVWFAQTEEEKLALDQYVSVLKHDRTLRFANRPYDTVVVQFAVSKFIPKNPISLAEQIQLNRRDGSRHSTPPPQAEEWH